MGDRFTYTFFKPPPSSKAVIPLSRNSLLRVGAWVRRCEIWKDEEKDGENIKAFGDVDWHCILIVGGYSYHGSK